MFDNQLSKKFFDSGYYGDFKAINYDNNGDLMYVSGTIYDQGMPPGDIFVFKVDRTVSFVDTFTDINAAGFLTIFDGKIYIESRTKISIIDIKTKSVLSKIPLACNLIGRFSVDANGNIVYACDDTKTVNLIASNGTRIGEPIPIIGNWPQFASLDSKGRIIVGTRDSLQIFF